MDMAHRTGCDTIPTEALWLDFLSKRSPHIPYLHKLVHYRGHLKRWRFYMEYCPNGDIREMINLYREFRHKHKHEEDEYDRSA